MPWSINLEATLSPASVAAAITAEQSFTVAGVLPGDRIFCNPAVNTPAGVFVAGCRVTNPDTVAINFANVTAGALVPTAATVYRFNVERG